MVLVLSPNTASAIAFFLPEAAVDLYSCFTATSEFGCAVRRRRKHPPHAGRDVVRSQDHDAGDIVSGRPNGAAGSTGSLPQCLADSQNKVPHARMPGLAKGAGRPLGNAAHVATQILRRVVSSHRMYFDVAVGADPYLVRRLLVSPRILCHQYGNVRLNGRSRLALSPTRAV
jgi:hypothetical protein